MFDKFQQSNSISIIEALYPEQITISLSPEEINRAKPREQDYSNDWARHNAWLNRLSVDAICKWLQEEIETDERIQIWEEDLLHTIWEVVNGTAIELSGKRIILIPKEDLDTEEFIVPAEWIKIHDWVGDYYLAVQVNLEDMWLRVWGCTTHKQIMQKGEYDSIWCNYCIGVEELISDLDVMLVARKYDAVNKLDVAPLSTFTRSQVNELMAELKQPSSFSPRYKVDIDRWCTFIADNQRRNKLYKRRKSVIKKPVIKINIKNWFKGIFEDFYYTDSEFFHPRGMLTPQWMNIYSQNLQTQEGISKSLEIDLGIKTFILQTIATINQNNNSDLLIKIYPSLKSEFLDLPVGIKVKIMDIEKNTLIEKEVSENEKTGRIECSIKDIQENEIYVIEMYFDGFSQICEIKF
ncbi:hypothetical protein STA3757_49700 (plasmid) [Stanieria sp. NIES-3757]|nr:hypothetical protein STA3757_49700 [Stanieria sp. NIES-3757]